MDEALNSVGKSIKGSRILVLGLAYKKNVDDTRESPSLTIIDMLIKSGADVQYTDPYLPEATKTRKFNFDMKSIDLTAENLKLFDVVLLITDHDDYDLIEKESKLIVDSRGKLKPGKNIFYA